MTKQYRQDLQALRQKLSQPPPPLLCHTHTSKRRCSGTTPN